VSPDGRGHQGRQHHPRGGPESTRSHTPTYARWRPPHGFAATGLRFQVTVGARARHLSVSPGEMQKVGIPCLKRMDSVVRDCPDTLVDHPLPRASAGQPVVQPLWPLAP